MAKNLKIEGFSFERIEHFKYLGALVNENANSHQEIREKLMAANRCYYGLSTLFKSKLLSRRSKITLYKVLLDPLRYTRVRREQPQKWMRKNWVYLKEKYFGKSLDQKRMKKVNLKSGQIKSKVDYLEKPIL